LFVIFNFSVLFATQFLYSKKEGDDLYLGEKGEQGLILLFTGFMLLLTHYSAKRLFKIHEIKNSDGYQWHRKDTRFNSLADIT